MVSLRGFLYGTFTLPRLTLQERKKERGFLYGTFTLPRLTSQKRANLGMHPEIILYFFPSLPFLSTIRNANRTFPRFHNRPKGGRREVVPSVGNLRFGGARARLVFGVSTLCGGFVDE